MIEKNCITNMKDIRFVQIACTECKSTLRLKKITPTLASSGCPSCGMKFSQQTIEAAKEIVRLWEGLAHYDNAEISVVSVAS